MSRNRDLELLRDLARRYADVAHEPIQDERRDLWRRLNGLERTRPLVIVRPGGPIWKETADVQPQCEDAFCRAYEAGLRQKLYHASMNDDTVFEPWVQIKASLVTPEGPWGPKYEYIHSGESGGAWQFDPAIREPEDVSKLVTPQHAIDEDETRARADRLREAVGDILPVCVSRAPFWNNSWHGDIITDLTRLRGLEQIMWDMVERPEWLHEVVRFMGENILRVQDEAEAAGDWHLCDHQNQAVPYSLDLPDPQSDGGSVPRGKLWAFCAAQEMEEVSPSMHEEFVLNYQLPWLRKFGLSAYGCCENLTNKIDMLRKVPNLRRIAVTLRADIRRCAEQIQDDYVMSWRPNPAEMVSCGFEPDRVRRVIREGMEAMKGRLVDITLKEIETTLGHPENLGKWVKTVREVSDEYA